MGISDESPIVQRLQTMGQREEMEKKRCREIRNSKEGKIRRKQLKEERKVTKKDQTDYQMEVEFISQDGEKITTVGKKRKIKQTKSSQGKEDSEEKKNEIGKETKRKYTCGNCGEAGG